jgi:eukaryotic-like serine/threonine-protein kinase
MTLTPGIRLGPYEIVSEIGAGGMGEVYRARDTKLGREVALKVLPTEFAADAERMARFEREAKVLASLNHPNIASIYGFEDSSGAGTPARALVMELVEGQTLAEMISSIGAGLKPAPTDSRSVALPLDEALPIAKQIAEGLEYAHERGIVHRDLKPANVKITPDGMVKILDFGLAKALEGDTAAKDPSSSPTMSRMATQAGIILGTAAYMSPEQAKGKAVDRRADIWAFGCVLYEMLTGKKPFEGETTTDILAAVVRAEPDWSQLPSSTPSPIRNLLTRCLKKDAKQRLQAIGEARIALEQMASGEIPESPGSPAAMAAPATAPLWRRVTPWALAAIAVLAAVAAVVYRPALPGPPPRKFEINIDKLAADWVGHPEISPDGTMIAYVSGNSLFIRDLDQLAGRKLYGLAKSGFGTPIFWSPDSRQIGYSDQGKLWRIPAEGGAATEICNLPKPILGAAWGADDEIIFSAWRSDLYEVSARGGDPKALGVLEKGQEVDFHNLSFIPGGHDLLYKVHIVGGRSALGVLAKGRRKRLLQAEGRETSTPVYSSTGNILYMSQGYQTGSRPTLWAVPFSLAKLSVTGEPFLVAGNARHPSISSDGTLIYEPPTPPRRSQLVWVSRQGTIEATIGQPQQGLGYPAPSPGGKRVAADALDESGNENIWIYDVARGVRTALLSSAGDQSDFTPAWTPNGSHIVFSAVEDISPNIWLQASDGSGKAQKLLLGEWPRPSPRGDYLTFVSAPTPATRRVCYVPLVAGQPPPAAKAVCLPATSSVDEDLRISPDERYAAYSAGDAAQRNVYITRFPSGEGRWRVSVDGGHSPVWGPRGDELFYIANGNMMSVHVTTQPSLQLGVPVKLFSLADQRLSAAADQAGPTFDISPDGRRFLMVQGVGEEPPGKIVVDQNWYAEFANRKQN